MLVRCQKCDGEARSQVADSYEVPKEKLGIKNVLIVGGVVSRSVCPTCGEVGITIPDLPGLIAAVAVARVRTQWRLEGDEIRFLRKACELTAKELAELLQVTAETVSRWENGKAPIGPSTEKLLRIHVGLALKERAPGVQFDQNEIVRLKITAVYETTAVPKMVFRRLPMVNKAQAEEVWLKAA